MGGELSGPLGGVVGADGIKLGSAVWVALWPRVAGSRCPPSQAMNTGGVHQVAGTTRRSGLVWVPGGEFWMGSGEHYPKEAPAHRVVVGGSTSTRVQ